MMLGLGSRLVEHRAPANVEHFHSHECPGTQDEGTNAFQT